MFLFAATFINTSHLLSASLIFFGVAIGGWLAIKPQQLIEYATIDDTDGWCCLIIQVSGQLLLAMTIVPIIITFLRWLYFP